MMWFDTKKIEGIINLNEVAFSIIGVTFEPNENQSNPSCSFMSIH